MRREVSCRAASPGVAFGTLWDREARRGRLTAIRTAADADERARLAAAIAQADDELAALQSRLGVGDAAAILDFQRELLQDPEMRARMDADIAGSGAGSDAEAAVTSATEHFAAVLEALDDRRLRERASDVRDLARRLLRALSGGAATEGDAGPSPGAPRILAAQRLFPSELLELDRDRIAGLCLIDVGASSHVVQLARALGMPAVSCDAAALSGVADGASVLIDGSRGWIVFDPHADEVAEAGRLRTPEAVAGRGHPVRITAVVGSIAEARSAQARGAVGIGLLRTEFLFAESTRATAPSVAEQVELYRRIVECFPQGGATIRLFDVGGDKSLSFLRSDVGPNPALGARGLRLLFEHESVLRDQMRAIATVARSWPGIRMLVPFVTDVGELRRVRAIYDETCAELPTDAWPKFGAMIEVPAAALTADVLVEHVDFFSIGTNDLAQYTLAADRDGVQYATYGDALHPSVLRLIEMTVQAAHARGKLVSVCGEAASNGHAAKTLIDLGVDELVVSW